MRTDILGAIRDIRRMNSDTIAWTKANERGMVRHEYLNAGNEREPGCHCRQCVRGLW